MDELARQVSQWITNRADTEWQSMIGEDNEAISDEDALIYAALEALMERLAEVMVNHPVVLDAMDAARYTIRENAADAAAYQRAMSGTVEDQLRYYGMSTKDFI